MSKPLSRASLEARVLSLQNAWTKFHEKRPEILYHYTDAQGLLGMLNSHRLWATNRRFMNDPTEAEYAAHHVKNVVDNHREKFRARLFDDVKGGIDSLLKAYLDEDEHYLACFCENGDLLSQWRGYGSVGGGYAVGFATEHLGLIHYESLEKPEPVLRKVLYDPARQQALTGKWVRFLFDWEILRRRQLGQETADMSFQDFGWERFSWFISQCLRCFKHPAYEEEQEWRVIQVGTAYGGGLAVEPDFRASRRGVVEFVKLDLPNSAAKLPVKVIRYGPTLDAKITERSLSLLCRGKGYQEVLIKKSIVPFAG